MISQQNDFKELKARIKADAETVSSALSAALAPGDGSEGFSRLFEAMDYTAASGGKRVRPFLTLSFCRACGGKDASALPFALAVECVHTYSLIHDDLPCMDDDELRRGLPSNHVRFGEATALLAGDGLLTHAFSLCASNTAVSDRAVREAVGVLAGYAGPHGMVGGQQLDLDCAGKKLALGTLFATYRLKTCALIEAACSLGMIAAERFDLTPARQYGEALGIAFQITDDLLDGDVSENSVLNCMDADEAGKTAFEYTEKAVEAVREIDRDGTLADFARMLRDRKN